MENNQQFWELWGNSEGQRYYNCSKYKRIEGYTGNSLHRFIFEDEEGMRLNACFEAYKTSTSDAPIMGLRMLSLIREDTGEAVKVAPTLQQSLFGLALAAVAEQDKEILENLPAW